GIAADALARACVGLVELDSERHVERPQAEAGEVLAQLLDAGLVANGRMRIRAARGRIGRIDAALAVNVIEPFGLQIVGLEIVVADRPGGGYAAMVPDLAEVLASQSKQSGPVELG